MCEHPPVALYAFFCACTRAEFHRAQGSSSSPGALATPSGPAGERSGSPISNGELVKNLGFENIRIWWQQKESVGDDPCEKGGFQIMGEAQKNEKEAKELTSLRDMMLTSQHDGGAVFDAQEECKLQQGVDNSSMFDNADDNDDTGLSQEEVRTAFLALPALSCQFLAERGGLAADERAVQGRRHSA